MVIQCENCRTMFNLDETLLKEGGSKVRCSLCKHLFMAYPPLGTLDEVEAETPIDLGRGGEDQPADELVSILDEREGPVAEGKDEDFEADLDRLYKDAFKEPAPALEEKGDAPSEEAKDLAEETITGEGGRLAEGPSVDFLPMDTVDDDRDAHEIPHGGDEFVKQAPSKKKSSKWGFFAVFGVILLVLLGAATAIMYWKPELISPYLSIFEAAEKKEPADAGVRLLQLKTVAGSFVDSEKGGQMFVIRGMVSNQYPTPKSYILIKGSILDNKGKVVESRLSYAGNTFTDEEIKTLPLEDIKKAMQNRDGMARQNFNLSSGATIPFMIVFDNLPDNLSEFAVETVSSSPGT